MPKYLPEEIKRLMAEIRWFQRSLEARDRRIAELCTEIACIEREVRLLKDARNETGRLVR